MSAESNVNENDSSAELPAWTDCDYFCIHDYAGSGAAPCGWRGRIHDTREDTAGTNFICPRCGFATLLRIPVNRADQL
jgi:hypothetical protein